MNVDSLMLQERNPHLLGMSFVNKIKKMSLLPDNMLLEFAVSIFGFENLLTGLPKPFLVQA